MTDAKVVEKKIYEEGKKHDDYASKAIGNAGLTLGIICTALGAGAWLLGGNNRSVFGSLGKEDVKDIDTENLVKYAHSLALDLLKDKDGVYNIRVFSQIR